MAFALRKGDARLSATGTPKADMPARALVRRLLDDPAVVVRHLRTVDNEENLSPAFLEAVKLKAGSRLGLHELEGELLEDVEFALWKRSWIEDARVDHAPGLRRTVVALDPADGTSEGEEQALCAAGVGVDGELYVLASEGTRETPLEWLKRALRLARELDAVIVVEKNHGGAFLTGLLEQAMGEVGVRVSYRMIDAHQGKRTRAEPVAVLYETGKVHHVGRHDVLEEQLVSFTGVSGQKSPDRLDAAVHGLRELMGYTGAPDTGPGIAKWTTDLRGIEGVARWGEGRYMEGVASWAGPTFTAGHLPLVGPLSHLGGA